MSDGSTCTEVVAQPLSKLLPTLQNPTKNSLETALLTLHVVLPPFVRMKRKVPPTTDIPVLSWG